MTDTSPVVGVIMGSTSDLPALLPAVRMLEQFGVGYEAKVVSAHRTPERMTTYARTARERGLRVIIAAAGGSAHLPGMVASETSLPVLGVAVEASDARTEAAVGSQIYMPQGKPLAFMGTGVAGAANAALFAVRVLALGDDELAAAYERYDAELVEKALTGDAELEAVIHDQR